MNNKLLEFKPIKKGYKVNYYNEKGEKQYKCFDDLYQAYSFSKKCNFLNFEVIDEYKAIRDINNIKELSNHIALDFMISDEVFSSVKDKYGKLLWKTRALGLKSYPL